MFWDQFGDFIDLDPDPHSSNYVDPDPHTINVDPHHCFEAIYIVEVLGGKKKFWIPASNQIKPTIYNSYVVATIKSPFKIWLSLHIYLFIWT